MTTNVATTTTTTTTTTTKRTKKERKPAKKWQIFVKHRNKSPSTHASKPYLFEELSLINGFISIYVYSLNKFLH